MVTADGYLGGVLHGVSPQTSKSKRHSGSTSNSLTRRALHPFLYVAPLDSLRSPSESFVAVPRKEDKEHLYKALELLELMPPTFSINKNRTMTIAGYKTSYVTLTETQDEEKRRTSLTGGGPGGAVDGGVMRAIQELRDEVLDGQRRVYKQLSQQINSMRGYEEVEMATEACFNSLREELMQHFDITNEADIDSMTVEDVYTKLFTELKKDPFPELRTQSTPNGDAF